MLLLIMGGNMKQVITKKQYFKGTVLSDKEYRYVVENSIDAEWWTKDSKYANKYLTTLKIIAKIK